MWWFFRRKHRKKTTHKMDILADAVHPKSITRPMKAITSPQLTGSVSRLRVERAVQMLLGAEDWNASYQVMRDEQSVLLTPLALTILDTYIEQARQHNAQGTSYIVQFLSAHRTLLEHARQVGIPTAWAEFQLRYIDPRPGSVQEPSQQAIIVLRRFLSAETWTETHALLIKEQEILLSVLVDDFLSALIAVSGSDDMGNGGLAYLTEHRTLLREARHYGIEEAWNRFMARRKEDATVFRQPEFTPFRPEQDVHAVGKAIRSLLTTRTWGQTYRALHRYRDLLLTETCMQMLRDLIRSHEQGPRVEDKARHLLYLRMHMRLIELAIADGIERAWDQFIEAMGIALRPEEMEEIQLEENAEDTSVEAQKLQRIHDAVEEFLGSISWEEAHRYLVEHQADLLNDVAFALIVAQADQLQARGSERDLYATRMLNLQAQLLRRAREVGIEQAWAEFENERE